MNRKATPAKKILVKIPTAGGYYYAWQTPKASKASRTRKAA